MKEKKKMLRNKSKIAIATLLTLSFAVSMFAVLPNVKSQIITFPDRPTTAYLSVNPTLIGLNQPLTVNLQVYPPPLGPNYESGTLLTGHGGLNGLHFENLTVTFTRPDGSKDTFMPEEGTTALQLDPGMTEEVGTLWFTYKPSQVGTWSVSFTFPGQSYTFLNWTVYYRPSTSRTITFTVQQDPVQIGLPPVALPTRYWERPINAQYREWYQISGDWIPRYINRWNIFTTFNPYSTAPNSAHIVWKRPSALGGLIGGGDWGSTSYSYGHGVVGGAAGPFMIWNGRAYYTIPGMTGTETNCVSLYSGSSIFNISASVTDGQLAAVVAPVLSLGVTGAGESFAGSATPYMWSFSATTGWTVYNMWTGALVRTITTNIPGLGTPVWFDDNICYVLRQGTWNPTTLRRPYNFLIKWNMSKVTGNNWLTGVEWNVTLKQPDGTGPGEGSRGSILTLLPTLGASGTAAVTTVGEAMVYAYDMNTGNQLWTHDVGWSQQSFQPWTPDENYVAFDTAEMVFRCLNPTTWNQLWEAQIGEYPWGSNTGVRQTYAYGNMYTVSYDGYLRCTDFTTGDIEWSFFTGNTTETVFETWAPVGSIAADGKIYFATSEHSPSQPRTRGNKLFCVDAFTGEGLWNISLAGNTAGVIADGYLIASNEYTGLMYCIGKGQTETTVAAPLTAISLGQSLTVQGTVMDLSPASAGTPAISDEDMSAWMNYLHMQTPTPMTSPDDDGWGTPVNPKGVEVSLDAVDPNNNFVHIATVTSDSSGLYSHMWKPEVPGKYTVIATFAGSESYWASYAETAVSVDEAPTVTPPAEQVPTDFTPMYAALAVSVIAIIVAIAIAVVLLLRKR